MVTKKLDYIFASDEMDWIMAKPTVKSGDIVKWAGKSYKLYSVKDRNTGKPRLTYSRPK